MRGRQTVGSSPAEKFRESGTARSSRHAVKHEFAGSHFAVIRLEDLDEIAKLKADAVACYCLVNAQEMFAVASASPSRSR
jgi:hypothetical protein